VACQFRFGPDCRQCASRQSGAGRLAESGRSNRGTWPARQARCRRSVPERMRASGYG
jgi:hypothetical protein